MKFPQATTLAEIAAAPTHYTCDVCAITTTIAGLLAQEHRVTGRRRLFCPNCRWDTGIYHEEV